MIFFQIAIVKKNIFELGLKLQAFQDFISIQRTE